MSGRSARAFSELTDSFWIPMGSNFQDVGWWRRPACMTKPLSNDLRERLVSAVDSGLSRCSAARRFGVAASTAIKWVNRWRRTGDVGPRPQGGDHRSHRIEAHAEEILALVDRRRTSPWARSRHTWTRGMAFPKHGDRHGMTSKKTDACEQRSFLRRRQAWFDAQPDLARAACSLTRPALTKMARRYGRAPRGERRTGASWTLEDDDLRWRAS